MSVKLLDQAQSLVADAMVAGILRERERIIELIQVEEWAGNSLAEDRENLVALIKGENK